MYNKRPVIECSDEAHTLRFINPFKMSGMVELVELVTLGVGKCDYSARYLGYLPSTAYLDYDGEMRLLLKCLKY